MCLDSVRVWLNYGLFGHDDSSCDPRQLIVIDPIRALAVPLLRG